MTLRISSLSAEFVRVTVEVDEDGAPADPTSQDVWLAFVAPGHAPSGGDWLVAEWEAGGGVSHTARVIASLAAGRYDIWVRVAWSPEDFRRRAGFLVVE